MQYLSNFRAVFYPKNKQLFGPILKRKLLIKPVLRVHKDRHDSKGVQS